MKLNSISIEEVVESNICKLFEDKLNLKHAPFYLQLSKIFKLPSLSKTSYRFIARVFTMLVESENFLQLDFYHLLKIISNSGLYLTSELEVFNAVDKWLNYNVKERTKFAEQLLPKVRFYLLSEDSFKFVSNKFSRFLKINETNKLFDVVERKKKLFKKSLNISCMSRSCDQKEFKILVFGGHHRTLCRSVENVNQVDLSSFTTLKSLSPFQKKSWYYQAVCLKGEAYLFGKKNDRLVADKYSPATDTWHELTDAFDDREKFCACAFVDKIYLFGGNLFETPFTALDSCLQFDPKQKSWSLVARMSEPRIFAACAHFQEAIVVSGGKNMMILNTVEQYDVASNKWREMPPMVAGKMVHSLVVVKRKLFAIDAGAKNACEVFDGDRWVALSTPCLHHRRALSVGNKIIVLQADKRYVWIYDVDEGVWSREPCEATRYIINYTAVKLP